MASPTQNDGKIRWVFVDQTPASFKGLKENTGSTSTSTSRSISKKRTLSQAFPHEKMSAQRTKFLFSSYPSTSSSTPPDISSNIPCSAHLPSPRSLSNFTASPFRSPFCSSTTSTSITSEMRLAAENEAIVLIEKENAQIKQENQRLKEHLKLVHSQMKLTDSEKCIAVCAKLTSFIKDKLNLNEGSQPPPASILEILHTFEPESVVFTELMRSDQLWQTIENILIRYPHIKKIRIEGITQRISRKLLEELLKSKPDTSRRQLLKKTTFHVTGTNEVMEITGFLRFSFQKNPLLLLINSILLLKTTCRLKLNTQILTSINCSY